MSDRKAAFRDRLAADLDYDNVREMLTNAMNGKTMVNSSCPGCKRTNRVEVTDYKTALQAASFWADHGFGKAAIAKAVEEADFSKRDPFELAAEERGQLLEKVLAAVEGKA